MDTSVKNKKLRTLPWYALHDIAVKKGIEEKEVNGKEKNTIIDKILSYGILSDEEIEQYVNDYIYGDRVTFTLWTFQSSLKDSDYGIVNGTENLQTEVEIPFAAIECFKHDSVALTHRVKAYAVNMNEKCGSGTCSYAKIEKCTENDGMACLPKVFYTILPGYRPQPHKGMEYGDVAAEVKIGNKAYDLKGIIKKNSENRPGKSVNDDEKIRKPLLSTSGEGQEIIRQFVEQGMIDARCQIIAVVIPQYIDAGFKGTLRHLARLSGKKVTFIELDELSELISINKKILVS